MSQAPDSTLAPEVEHSSAWWIPTVGAIVLATLLAAFFVYAWSTTGDANPAEPATMLRALALSRWNPLVRVGWGLGVLLAVAAAGVGLTRPTPVARRSVTLTLWLLGAACLVASLWLTPAAPRSVHIDPTRDAGAYLRGATLCLLAAVLGASTVLVGRGAATARR